MNVWFSRTNGSTAHNDPKSVLYIRGEPPEFPDKKFNYKDICLQQGFARLGFPAAGDLRSHGWREQAKNKYGHEITNRDITSLDGFLSIMPGDIFLIPAGNSASSMHLGIVAPTQQNSNGSAYCYHYDISNKDWYENAHRVDVRWAINKKGEFLKFNIQGVSYRNKFCKVNLAKEIAIKYARESFFQKENFGLETFNNVEEDVSPLVYIEGATRTLLVNAYERNDKARAACLAFYGNSCCICGFSFEGFYGEVGRNFIHIHHIKPLSEIKVEYEVDPIKDLRPVCANCHSMIHRKIPAYSVGEIKDFLKK